MYLKTLVRLCVSIVNQQEKIRLTVYLDLTRISFMQICALKNYFSLIADSITIPNRKKKSVSKSKRAEIVLAKKVTTRIQKSIYARGIRICVE